MGTNFGRNRNIVNLYIGILQYTQWKTEGEALQRDFKTKASQICMRIRIEAIKLNDSKLFDNRID